MNKNNTQSHNDNDKNIYIDYNEKINNFLTITDCHDENTSFAYLEKYNWDENKAAIAYLNDTSKLESTRDNSKLNKKYPNYETLKQNDIENQNFDNSNNRRIEITHTEIVDNNISAPDRSEQPGFVRRIFINPVSNFFSAVGNCFCARTQDRERDVNINNIQSSIFERLPCYCRNSEEFVKRIKDKIGLLIIYRRGDLEYFSELFKELNRLEYIIDILNVNYVMHCVDENNQFGIRALNLLQSHSSLALPKFVACFNTSESSFTNTSIIDIIDGKPTVDSIRDMIIRNIETKEEKIEKFNLKKIQESKSKSHGDVIRSQKEELEYLEYIEEENARLNKENEEKLKNDEKLKLEKERKALEEIEKLKNEIPAEPETNEKDITNIMFRYPDGNKRIERRFNRSDKVKHLYMFITSLGPGVLTESEEFDLIIPFPFKIYNDKEKTLLEEGLFPNAVLQIREV